jgi:hypothetical protein
MQTQQLQLIQVATRLLQLQLVPLLLLLLLLLGAAAADRGRR